MNHGFNRVIGKVMYNLRPVGYAVHYGIRRLGNRALDGNDVDKSTSIVIKGEAELQSCIPQKSSGTSRETGQFSQYTFLTMLIFH